MRRAAPWALVVGLLGAPSTAAAEPWTMTMEGGAEADSNVERVETVPGGMTDRIAAPVARAGARLEHKRRLLGGSLALSVSGLARMVASSRTRPENVMLYAAESRWLHPIGANPVSAGVAITAADAQAITGGTGARTFRNLGVDGVLTLGSGDDHRLVLAAGGRDFSYKPNHAFDWRGPSATARLDMVLWQSSGKTESLELSVALGFEARTYASTALVNVCPPDAPPSYECSAWTALIRRDRYQRAGIELSWVGDIVLSGGYQLTVIDSNSYGQSLIRHRVTTSATAELGHKLFGTATATLQIDQFPGGVLVERYIQHQEFTNLEDENRSSIQVRLARELSPTWSLEVRGALWRDLGNTGTESFRRELIYTGVVYAH